MLRTIAESELSEHLTLAEIQITEPGCDPVVAYEVTCSRCDETDIYPDREQAVEAFCPRCDCATCEGSGLVAASSLPNWTGVDADVDCSVCGGSGVIRPYIVAPNPDVPPPPVKIPPSGDRQSA